MRRGGAADDDVDFLKFTRPPLEMNGASAEVHGQGFRPIIRTVRDDDALCAAGEQSARGLFTGVTRADDHHVPAMQSAEDLLRQLYRHRPHRHAAALDVGPGADLFGNIERPLKRLVQSAAGLFVLQRQVVSPLKLPEDFGLTQHHRVDAAGDFEQMFDALRLAQIVDLLVQWAAIIAPGNQELAQRLKR